MLTPDLVQSAIIQYLKNITPLPDRMKVEEIREDNWNGTEFGYPNYRVNLQPLGPYGNGNCRLTMVQVAFSVYAYDEDTSSRKAAELTGWVANALFGHQLIGEGFVPVTRIDIPDGGVIPPAPEGERLWRGEVMFTTVLQQVN